MSTDEIAILHIELVDIEPLVWRRVAVHAATSLATLHRIIQGAMGWLDYHLFAFAIDGKTYGVPDPDGFDWGRRTHRADTARLSRVLDAGIDSFTYVYDMGDDWAHRITIERIEPADPAAAYPQFLGGERRCPPEDCGGIPGYYQFLDDIAGPDTGRGSRAKKAALRWYGQAYDPHDIDEDLIRAALTRIARASRRRPKPDIKA